MPRVKLFDEQEVLNKAINLFWKQGYAATSVQDLVNHLGINRASIYGTFGDKETLYKKALEEYRKTNLEGIKRFFENHLDIKEGFKNLFQKAVDEAIKDKDRKGCFVVNTTTELVPNDSDTLQILAGNKLVFEQIFFDYLSWGLDKGQISSDKDLKAISSLLYTYYNGLRVVTKVDTSKTELYKSINVLLSVLD